MNLNIALNKGYLNAAGGVTVTFSFSEAVTGFTNADISTAYGGVTLVGSSNGGKTWTGTLNANGAAVEGVTDAISVDMSGVLDSSSVAGSGVAKSNSYVVDTVGPTIVSFGSYGTFNINNYNDYRYATVGVVFSELVASSKFAMTGPYLNFIDAYTYVNGGFPTYGTDWNWFASSLEVDGAYNNQFKLDLTKVIDQYGNAGIGTVTNPTSYTVDRVRPTATVTVDKSVINSQALVTVNFSEKVYGVDVNDFTVGNGTLTNLVAVNPDGNNGSTTWTATLVAKPGNSSVGNKVALNLIGVQDLATNTGDHTVESNAYQVDTIVPTVLISLSDDTLKAGDTAIVTLTFSEKISGLTLAAINTPNATLSNLVSNDGGLTWTADLVPTTATTAGSNAITLAGQTVHDVAGNYLLPASSPNYKVDTVAPTAAVAVTTTTLIHGQSSAVTVVFSEAVSGLTPNDFALQQAVLSNLASSDGGVTWTATLTPNDNVVYQGYLQLHNTGNAVDAAGNKLASTYSSQLLTYETTRPTGTVEVVNTKLGIGGSSQVKVKFSEALSGLLLTSMYAENGTLSNLQNVDGYNWTATLTPGSGVSTGTGKVYLVVDTVRDDAGNFGSGVATSSSYAIDQVRPTVAIALSDYTLTVGEQALVTFTFSEAVSDFSLADLDVSNGSLGPLSSGDAGVTWSATYTPDAGTVSGNNAIKLRDATVEDVVGNRNSGTVNSNNFTINTVRPTASIAITDNQLKAGETSLVTITFSEAVSGFTNDDLTIGNGTLSPVVTHDGGMTWTATLTPTAGHTSGGNSIVLDTAGVTNGAGNAGSGTTPSGTYSIDTARPTASVGVAPAILSGGQTALVTITFSEAVTGLTNANLAIANGVLSPVLSGDNGVTWTATLTPSAATESATNHITLDYIGVADAAGNAGLGTINSVNYAVDTVAPVFASARVNGLALVLTYTDGGTLDATHLPAPGAFAVMVGAVPNAVTTVSVNAAARTVTLTLATTVAHGEAVTVAYMDPSVANDTAAIQDAAGNDADTLAATAVINDTPAPDAGGSAPSTTTVDGVPVTTAPGPGGATVISVPVVPSIRLDAPGSGSPLADIPLVRAADGQPIVSVSVPAGVGFTAEGLATGTTGAAALAELGLRIERITGPNTELTNAGGTFYATLAPGEQLNVQIIKPTLGAGYDGSQPLVINGSTNPAHGKQAIIIDARALPSGTVIQVDNIEFVAVVGDVRLVGGAGRNMASGDGGNQWIVLGPGDDIIHGGAGNDFVGSEAGDDQVFGDAGDDLVFGGAGNDILSGGAGSDRLNGGTGFDLALQEGKKTDYAITLEGAGIKLTHIASGVSDWLVDVEQVRFETGPMLTVAHSAAEEAAAFLLSKWLGRDLTQGEGAVIQTLAGMNVEQVATAFAQLFPTQTAGKTAAQLLDGMASAGAIRVDALREVTVSGDAGDNTITSTLGLARYVDGGAGVDTFVLPATFAQTHIQAHGNGAFTLQRMTDGAMLDVSNVERIRFNDTQLALDLNGHAGEAVRLLGALAGPSILANKGVVGEVIRLLDAGASSQTIAGAGLQLLGMRTPAQIAQTLWTSVVGRAGTDTELKTLTAILASGVPEAELVVMAAHLDATAARIDLVGLAARGIEFA